MKLDASQKFGGYPILVIRDLLKWCALSREGVLRQHLVAQRLKITEKEGWLLIFDLHRHDYVQVAPPVEGRKGQWFELTTKGRSLALAKAIPPITRARADELVAQLLIRAKHLNTKPAKYMIGVRQLVLFGSYLSAEKDLLNDLDVAVEYKINPTDPQEYLRGATKLVVEALANGRRFRSYAERQDYPLVVTKRFLRGRTRSISLHSTDDPVLLQTATKQIYFAW
jgi:predicted nucleotidyltransferase